MILDRIDDVVLGPGHIYKQNNGTVYTSVSSLYHKVEPEFDRDRISYYTARKRVMARYGILDAKQVKIEDIKQEQQVVLLEWDSMGQESIDHGDLIHKAMEDYSMGKPIEPRLAMVGKEVMHLLRHYYKLYPEFLLTSPEHKVAGMADLVCQRQSSENSIFDIKDYKTNLRKGIQFDSTYVKDGKRTHPNQMFKKPLEHLEYCNFTLYALKMSTYALMLERRYKVKIGNLEIIYIFAEPEGDDQFLVNSVETFPIPYMRTDAEIMLEYFRPNTDTDW